MRISDWSSDVCSSYLLSTGTPRSARSRRAPWGASRPSGSPELPSIRRNMLDFHVYCVPDKLDAARHERLTSGPRPQPVRRSAEIRQNEIESTRWDAAAAGVGLL